MDAAAEQEFRAYVTARQGALYRASLLLTGHREDAEDLLQLALTKLAARWVRVHRTGSPDRYVRKILYHQHVSRWRIRRRRAETIAADPPEVAAPHDQATDSVMRLAVAQALRQLTPKQRAVLVLRYFEDLPEAEVAALLGCTVGTVRSQTHRSLARLRALCPDLSSILETA
jgi:RNA polymerase sigma-70 factor (sigma-E family)